jgi:hypothetical protein
MAHVAQNDKYLDSVTGIYTSGFQADGRKKLKYI